MISNLSNSAVPRPLKIVAYLFLVVGILSLMDTVVGVFTGRIVFNLGILYLLIGRGLLRLNPRWLAWAMFSTLLDLVLIPIAAAVMMFTPRHLQHLQMFGLDVGQAPLGSGFVFLTATFALLCWQQGILKSRQVRELFLN